MGKTQCERSESIVSSYPGFCEGNIMYCGASMG